jgi:sigma-B regulation protein RsbU (phosphoserine phosphatase)
METLRTDFGDIVVGIIVTAVGLISIVISFFRLKSKDYALLSAGLLFLIDGIRWLNQVPTMQMMVGFTFNSKLLGTLLTYAVVIPLSAFLLEIFGKGFYNSMLWVFRSAIVYAIIATAYILINPGQLPEPAIIPLVVILWCLVWVANLIFVKNKSQIELQVLRIVSVITLISVAHDQLVIMQLVPWGVHFEHATILLFCGGLTFVAAHHFFASEKKLLVIEQEIEIAWRIQQSNLPINQQPPEGLTIASRYIPMSAVAGDFYDFQVKGEKGIGILLADVSGHGVGAALIGSMLKIAFASQAEHLSDPAKVLSEINRILRGKIEGSFVTACSIFIDIAKLKLYYANAGHPPSLLWRRSKKEMYKFPLGGMILGPFPDPVYENVALNISKDDRLVLYTDGVIEAMNKTGELFGENRLEALIQRNYSDLADRTVDQFIEHLMKWSGRTRESSFEDDLTLIIIDIASDHAKPASIVSQQMVRES